MVVAVVVAARVVSGVVALLADLVATHFGSFLANAVLCLLLDLSWPPAPGPASAAPTAVLDAVDCQERAAPPGPRLPSPRLSVLQLQRPAHRLLVLQRPAPRLLVFQRPAPRLLVLQWPAPRLSVLQPPAPGLSAPPSLDQNWAKRAGHGSSTPSRG